eukprot:gene31221-40586_t
MNEQRIAILKAYKLKVEQEVVLPSPQLISTYGPVRNESPKMLDKHVGVIRYSKPPDSTKVQDYETSRQQMFLGTPSIHKKLHSPESFPQTYAVKRDPACADGVGNISEGPNKATILLTDAFSGSRSIPGRTGDFSNDSNGNNDKNEEQPSSIVIETNREEEKEKNINGSYIVLAVLLITFASNQWSRQAMYYLCDFSAGSVGESFKYMNRGLDFSKDMYAALASLGFTLVFATVSLFSGSVTDKYPRNAVATISCMAWSLATALQTDGQY